jgi:hypothetical protein
MLGISKIKKKVSAVRKPAKKAVKKPAAKRKTVKKKK